MAAGGSMPDGYRPPRSTSRLRDEAGSVFGQNEDMEDPNTGEDWPVIDAVSLWIGIGMSLVIAVIAVALAIAALVAAGRNATEARQANATAQWAVAELRRLTGSPAGHPPDQAMSPEAERQPSSG